MKMKKGISRLNVISIPLIFIIMNALSFYAGAMLPLILQSEDFYDIPDSILGQVTGNVMIWDHLVSAFMLPFATFIFEIFGRRLPVAGVLLSTVALVYLIPVVSPNLKLLIAIRCFISMNKLLMLGIPLITDYIK